MRAFSDRFIARVLALGVLVLGVLGVPMPGAQAGPYEDALSRFSADSFDQTIEGINEVVASGNARAAAIITALQEGRLLFSAESKRVFIGEPPDRLSDAATGEPVAGSPPADLAPVRLNNRLRRIVEASSAV
jgi:urea transport system permease protein